MFAITSERDNNFGKTSFLFKTILLKHFALEVWVSIDCHRCLKSINLGTCIHIYIVVMLYLLLQAEI